MRLPQAYRSLPRLSSELKPSYPSNSKNSSLVILFHIPSVCGKFPTAYFIEYKSLFQEIFSLRYPNSFPDTADNRVVRCRFTDDVLVHL